MDSRWLMSNTYGLASMDDLIDILQKFKTFFSAYEKNAEHISIISIESDDVNDRADLEVHFVLDGKPYYQKFLFINGEFLDGKEFHTRLKKEREKRKD